MYKFIQSGKSLTLKSRHYTITLIPKKGHIHVIAKGPNGYRVQGMSSVKDKLTQFEMKAAALHFFTQAREQERVPRIARNSSEVINANYAQIFGSCFD